MHGSKDKRVSIHPSPSPQALGTIWSHIVHTCLHGKVGGDTANLHTSWLISLAHALLDLLDVAGRDPAFFIITVLSTLLLLLTTTLVAFGVLRHNNNSIRFL